MTTPRKTRRNPRTRQPAEPVDVSRASKVAYATALELAGGDRRRLAAALEPDGRVSVTVLNRPRQLS